MHSVLYIYVYIYVYMYINTESTKQNIHDMYTQPVWWIIAEYIWSNARVTEHKIASTAGELSRNRRIDTINFITCSTVNNIILQPITQLVILSRIHMCVCHFTYSKQCFLATNHDLTGGHLCWILIPKCSQFAKTIDRCDEKNKYFISWTTSDRHGGDTTISWVASKTSDIHAIQMAQLGW